MKMFISASHVLLSSIQDAERWNEMSKMMHLSRVKFQQVVREFIGNLKHILFIV